MPDDNDKIRRNLVVASSAVIASSFLGISLGDIWTSLGWLGGVTKPQPNELLICGLSVLLYLGLRYRFSVEGEQFVKDRAEILSKLRERYVDGLVTRQARSYIRTGRLQGTNFPELGPLRKTILSTIDGSHAFTIVVLHLFEVTIHGRQPNGWSGQIIVSTNWDSSDGDLIGTSRETRGVYGMGSKVDRTYVRVRAWLTATFYSKEAVLQLFPVFLGMVATSILSCRAVF